MATAWQVIFRQADKHANAFKSGNAATVSTDYLTSPLTTTQVVDPFFNLDFIKDKCIDAYGRLALEIANVRQHPWRAFVTPSTATVTNGSAIPTLADNGKTIVGALGQVLNGGRLMTERSPEAIDDYLRHTSALYSAPDIYYCDGVYLYSSAASGVTINVCTYERADTVTTVAANGNIALPDVLADAIVAGAVAQLIVEAKGMEQAAAFANYFQQAITSIREGQTRMPMFTLPATA